MNDPMTLTQRRVGKAKRAHRLHVSEWARFALPTLRVTYAEGAAGDPL